MSLPNERAQSNHKIPNNALRLTAIPLRSIAAGALRRYRFDGRESIKAFVEITCKCRQEERDNFDILKPLMRLKKGIISTRIKL